MHSFNFATVSFVLPSCTLTPPIVISCMLYVCLKMHVRVCLAFASLYACIQHSNLHAYLSERSFQVQIRPWKLMDSDFVMDNSQPLDPRKTIFVGGVPRPLKAG